MNFNVFKNWISRFGEFKIYGCEPGLSMLHDKYAIRLHWSNQKLNDRRDEKKNSLFFAHFICIVKNWISFDGIQCACSTFNLHLHISSGYYKFSHFYILFTFGIYIPTLISLASKIIVFCFRIHSWDKRNNVKFH